MRLELIMTDRKLTADDARALLSDHVEGTLDDGVRSEIDTLLANDPVLAKERQRLATTLGMLKALPRPEAPGDMVGKVRDKLAAERRKSEQPAPDNVVRPRWRRWAGIEAAIGLAAAASIAVFIAVAGPSADGDGKGTSAAGIAGDAQPVAATLVAPGLPAELVTQLATGAGMTSVAPNTWQGDRRAAARFLVSLKQAAAERGVEVSGFLPDAEALRIEVRAQ